MVILGEIDLVGDDPLLQRAPLSQVAQLPLEDPSNVQHADVRPTDVLADPRADRSLAPLRDAVLDLADAHDFTSHKWMRFVGGLIWFAGNAPVTRLLTMYGCRK